MKASTRSPRLNQPYPERPSGVSPNAASEKSEATPHRPSSVFDGWTEENPSSGSKARVSRLDVHNGFDAGSTFGSSHRAVSAAMLGVTGVGVLMSSPFLAEAVFEDPSNHLTDDLESAALVSDSDPISTKANRVMEEFGKNIEKRMRLSPHEIRHSESVNVIEGHATSTGLSDEEVKEMVFSALKDMPLGALPGGESVAGMVEALPNFGDKDASNMSYREIGENIKRNNKKWFYAKFGAQLEAQKIETAVLGFATVAGIRAASPEASDFINKYGPSINFWRKRSLNGNILGHAAIKYRGDELLPNIDFTAKVKTDLGPVKLRAVAKTALSLENSDHIKALLAVDAKVGGRNTWANAMAWVYDDTRYGVGFELGKHVDINGLSIDARSGLGLGPGTAKGPAEDGRLSFEIEASKNFYSNDNSCLGGFGLYANHSVDTGGGAGNTHFGAMFRWNW